MSAQDLLASAREALAGRPAPGVQVLRGGRPPLRDPALGRALGAPALAVFLIVSAFARERSAGVLDPASLLLRGVGLAALARSLVLAPSLVARLRWLLAARRCSLVTTASGLVLEVAGRARALAWDAIVDVRRRGDLGDAPPRPHDPLYLVLGPDAPEAFVALPPLFDASPAALAARLSRHLRGRAPRAGDAVAQEVTGPSADPAATYDAAAAGRAPPGAYVLRHGRAWMSRGPYASLVLGAVVLDAFTRLPDSVALEPLVPALLAGALWLAPVVWLAHTARQVAVRRGLALVLTPRELLMRTRDATLALPLSRLGALEVDTRLSWSLLGGLVRERTLVIGRDDGTHVRYDEAYLGAPVEVVAALLGAYRPRETPITAR